jgi:hypothetical protein
MPALSIKRGLLNDFETFKEQAYSTFDLPSSHDPCHLYLRMCHKRLNDKAKPAVDGDKSPLNYFNVMKKGDRDMILLGIGELLVALAGFHALVDNQSTLMEKEACAREKDYHLKLDRTLVRD